MGKKFVDSDSALYRRVCESREFFESYVEGIKETSLEHGFVCGVEAAKDAKRMHNKDPLAPLHVPLSQRVRPDCEAAPWVIKEIEKLEKELEEERELYFSLLRRNQSQGWEIEWLNGERCIHNCEPGLADEKCGECIYCAFERGAEAMREEAARLMEHKPRHKNPLEGGTTFAQFGCGYYCTADRVRSLPTPKYK